MKEVIIIGAGLAGSEAALQLAKKGIKVKLYEMKPKFTPAHKNPNLAELVCSNSLKSNELATSGGLLKEELRRLDSLLIKIADDTKVPAGGSLSVDRELFSEKVTNFISNMDNIEIIREEVSSIDYTLPTIIASGPLTSDALASEVMKLVGREGLYFFDAIAPIVNYDSIDFNLWLYRFD